jgi:hypothetical protein
MTREPGVGSHRDDKSTFSIHFLLMG